MREVFISCTLLALATAGCVNQSDGSDPIATEAIEQALHSPGTQAALVWDFTPNVKGFAILQRKGNHVNVAMSTRGLIPDYPYTMWFCGFNNPSACENGNPPIGDQCGEPDFEVLGGNPDADDFCFWSGGQAVANRFGFGAFRSVVVPGFDEGQNLFGTTYHDVNGSEIHVIIRRHGAALDGEGLFSQLTQFNGGCPPGIPEVDCINVLQATFPGF